MISSPARVDRGRRKLFEVPIPIRVGSLTEVLRIGGVGIYLHWTILLIAGVILANVIRRPITSLVALSAYFGVLLIHECGHMIVAKRLHSQVFSIELYPIFGICRFEVPWSRFDHCLIAWGGVIAQAIIALPIIGFVTTVGYTRFNPINAALVLLGCFSLAVAMFNLLPARNLDGSIAWAIIPEMVKRNRLRSLESHTWKR